MTDPASNAPSSASTDPVALSIQPVIVYSPDDQPQHQPASPPPPPPPEQQQQSANGSHKQVRVPSTYAERPWLHGFERESKLLDISPTGQPIFETKQSPALELRSKIQRLWAERGDFSRFSTAALVQAADRKASRKRSASSESVRSLDSSDNDVHRDRRRRSFSYERDAPRYLSDSEDEDGGTDDDEEDEDEEDSDEENVESLEDGGGARQGLRPGKRRKQKHKHKKDRNRAEKEPAAQIQESDVRGRFIDEKVFTPLWNEMLGRLDHAHVTAIHAHQLIGMLLKASKASTAAPPSVPSLLAAGRSSSPAPSTLSATASQQQSKATGDDFVIDPLSIGVSRIKVADPSTGGEDEDEEGDDGDRLEQDQRPMRAAMRNAASSDAQRLFDRKVCIAQKRASLQSAAEVLRTGAKELRASHAPERERWRGLRELKQRGWRLTPGRPLNDQYGAANLADEDPLPGLRGFGTPIYSEGKVKEEGARDAWIGFGAPESSVQQRRRTLAYWADALDEADAVLPGRGNDGGSSKDGKAEGGAAAAAASEKLVFPYRPKKRLRVKFVLHPSDAAGEQDGDAFAGGDGMVWTSDRPASGADAASRSQGGATGSTATASLGEQLDRDLQAAQQEFADEETYRDIVHQSRQLDAAFDVRLSDSSVSIEVTSQLDVVFELVDTSPPAPEDAHEGQEGTTTAEGRTTPDDTTSTETRPEYSAYASLVLAFARFAPLRKYLGRREALSQARSGDVYAKAQAVRAQSLAIPRGRTGASTSSSSGQAPSGSTPASAPAPATTTTDPRRPDATASNQPGPLRAPIHTLNTLGPLLTLVHYASFLHRLRALLATSVETFNAAHRPDPHGAARYDLTPLCLPGRGVADWLGTAVERGLLSPRPGGTDAGLFQLDLASAASGSASRSAGKVDATLPASSDERGTGGDGAVFVGTSCIATLSLTLPSHLNVHFPRKTTPEGRGVSLSLDLATFQHLLQRELDSALSS